MKLNIINTTDRLLTCFEHPIANIINYYNRDYTMMFETCWNFSENILLNYEGVHSSCELGWLIENVELNTGISFKVKEALDFNLICKEIVFELEQGRPVIAYVNTYWCPWLLAYQKNHTPHYILIVGIDIDRQEFYCIDMMSTSMEVLPFINFNKGMKEYFTFDILDKPRISKQEIYNNLMKAIDRIDGTYQYNMFANMAIFTDKIRRGFDIKSEIKGYDPYKFAPIFTWLKGIGTARKKFTYVLNFIDKNNEIKLFSEFTESFHLVYNKWTHIILMLFKAVYSSNPQKLYGTLANKLDDIRIQEEKISYKLKEKISTLI
ncbi:BtrH N-terminal domain-containing protein (plasmid) [Bacillus cereus]|uniref:BtrH N-terminal domain-containing protein n=1 Tax=Bacillus cereus TaxID=1396 RepID=A0AB73UTK5_BACCE|nr:BtrH N-terminal domain-containing protein [Bacillus cereus]QHV47435.2 BtrH N-terminal domain-containing protein [Bacillus cereus]HDR3523482.1 BtrH N-terminal domain-containing protein [Bacillus pacificus]HDR3634039.1 BtrH N-terminal domain-containing protein [Bacillus pacificus]HDR7652975.1 BtrH N-terminal domain-containing protein [Bacillus pacificus]